jgi:hypothetical protein
MTISPLNALVARLESVEALDGPGRTVGRRVRALLPRGAPKDLLSGAWLGHAVHPIMTDIPIGAWTSSVLLDWLGGKDSRSASDRLIVAGVLAAGLTVVTGWSDWADVEERDAAVRRAGLVHAGVNATATALMLGSYVARRRGARGRGKLLSLAGSTAAPELHAGCRGHGERPRRSDGGDDGHRVRLSAGAVAKTAPAAHPVTPHESRGLDWSRGTRRATARKSDSGAFRPT